MFRDMLKESMGPALMAVHGEACTAHPPTGGAIPINARPVDAKLITRPSMNKKALSHKLILQVAKADLLKVIVNKTQIEFPGDWVESTETTVKWMVAGILKDTASPAHWFLGMTSR